MPDRGTEFGIGGTGQFKPMLLTFNADGSDVRLALSNDVWGKGGHHPNWHPDGEHILMNLKLDYDWIKFCSFRYDGSDFRVHSEAIDGSGHPSFHKNGRYIVSDVYPEEPFALASKEVPIRLIGRTRRIFPQDFLGTTDTKEQPCGCNRQEKATDTARRSGWRGQIDHVFDD